MTGSRLLSLTEVQEPNEYTNRPLYNILALQSHRVFKKALHKTFNDLPFERRLFVEPATITNSKDTLSPGILTYLNWLGVPTGNAFMSGFLAVLFFGISAFAFAVVGHVVVQFLSERRKGIWYDGLSDAYRRLALPFGIRLVCVPSLYNYISSFTSRTSSPISQ